MPTWSSKITFAIYTTKRVFIDSINSATYDVRIDSEIIRPGNLECPLRSYERDLPDARPFYRQRRRVYGILV